MKLPKLPLAGTLLVLYAVYSTFVPVSIAHSIILFSLAAVYGFDKHLQSTKIPSTQKLVHDLREELYKEMKQQKEIYESKLAELKQEQQRIAIERANASSSVSSKPKSTIQF